MVELALRRVGERLVYHRDVEILLVGGAAAMLTGVLPPRRTTVDCDVMVYAPSDAMSAVEAAAEQTAEELQLAPRWLNSDVQIRTDSLPPGWEARRVLVGVHGRLHVWSASRPDLIAMKLLAGRPQDLEDLRIMKVRADEAEFVRDYLDGLAQKGTSQEQIDDARKLVDALETREHE